MKYQEIKEYQKTIQRPVPIPDFTNGQQVGTIQTGVGPLEVWKMIDEHMGYAAVDSKIGAQSPLSFLAFEVFSPAVLIARNATTLPAYQKKGISSELFLFVNKADGYKILSDTLLTDSGESLWAALIASSKFSTKIAYLPTSETFVLSAVGIGKTRDGHIIKSPKDDNLDHNFYDSKTKQGQRFFYLIEAPDKFSFVDNKEILCEYGVDVNRLRWKGKILQPYRHFDDEDP